VNSLHSTVLFATTKIRPARIVVKLGIANTTVLRQRTSLQTSSVVFVAMLATWPAIVLIVNVEPTGATMLRHLAQVLLVALVLVMQLTENTSNSCKNSPAGLLLEMRHDVLKLALEASTKVLLLMMSSHGNVVQLVLLLPGRNVEMIVEATILATHQELQEVLHLGLEIVKEVTTMATTTEIVTKMADTKHLLQEVLLLGNNQQHLHTHQLVLHMPATMLLDMAPDILLSNQWDLLLDLLLD
jgi:hypothetical protein